MRFVRGDILSRGGKLLGERIEKVVRRKSDPGSFVGGVRD